MNIEKKNTQTRYGQMRLLDQDSVVSRSLSLYGEWAQEEIEFLLRLIEPGATVLDIGAFIGTHTLAFSSRVGAKGKVVAFEPRIEAFSLLEENMRMNQRLNVDLHWAGVAEDERTIKLRRLTSDGSTNYAGLSLKIDELDPPGETYEVPLRTVDSLPLARLDLVKIDVEGMEREVLDGASQTLARFKPAICAECNSISAGLRILEWCLANEYECFGFITDGFNPNNFSGATENIFGNGKELNFLLLPQGRPAPAGILPIYAIDHADDIAALLFQKPQYPHEVLEKANRGSGPGLQNAPWGPQRLAALTNECDARQRQVLEASEAASRLRTELDRLREELDRLKSESHAMRAKMLSLITRSTDMAEQADRANSDLKRSQAEIDAASRRAADAQRERDTAIAELHAIRRTISWKIAAPIRLAGRGMHLLKRLVSRD